MSEFDYIEFQISESTGEVEANYFTDAPKLPPSVVFSSAPIPTGTYRVVNGQLFLLTSMPFPASIPIAVKMPDKKA
jgi:hypothetical protein